MEETLQQIWVKRTVSDHESLVCRAVENMQQTRHSSIKWESFVNQLQVLQVFHKFFSGYYQYILHYALFVLFFPFFSVIVTISIWAYVLTLFIILEGLMKLVTKFLTFVFAFALFFTGQNLAFAEDQYTDNLIPKMTSESTPEGKVEVSSTYSRDNGAVTAHGFYAFDRELSSGWQSVNGQPMPQWISYEFTTPKKISTYTIQLRYTVGRPKSWIFQGWDGQNWVDLDSVSKSTDDWSSNLTKQSFAFSNDNEYKKYRLYITETFLNKTFVDIMNIEMMAKISTPTLPGIPSNLTGTAGNAKNIVSWNAANGATIYNLKRATTAGGPYNTISTNLTDTTYTDTGVTNGTTYYYVVSAVNGDGESGNSNEVALTPQEDIVLPDTPTLTGTAGNLKNNLSWSSVSGADSYNLKRSTTPGGPYTTIANNLTSKDYTDTAVTNGTTYYYVVTLVNKDGESGNSNEVALTPKDGTDPHPTGDRALLVITMLDGNIKEYDLTINQVNDFISWFEDQADRNGNRAYIFTKNFNMGPFTSIKEYIAFSKIQSFEVKQYSK